MYNTDTIVAVGTPNGNGALALIRLSGLEAHTIFSELVIESEKFSDSKAFSVKLYTLIEENRDVIDESMAIRYNSPSSFTGENMVEITVHGGKIIVERVISRIIALGARYAGRGEFSRRAFLNGKIDLKKAESIHRIIHAESLLSHKNAVKHYLGDDKLFFDDIKNDIRLLLVSLESEIEFSETDELDAEELFAEKMSHLLARVKKSLEKELHKKARLKELDKGINVALVGKANAGKSSILNMVLGYDRAIITEVAGTTRDLISESRLIGDCKVTFVDTAGLNKTENKIELEGIRRTHLAATDSDILCWIISSDREADLEAEYLEVIEDCGESQLITIINKEDLGKNSKIENFLSNKGLRYQYLSAKTNFGENDFMDKIENIVKEKFSDIEYETVIGSEREEGIIRSILSEIEEIDFDYPLEIVTESVRTILAYFSDIYGVASPEDILNQVFGEFCIGK